MLHAILETLGVVGILLSMWAKFRARPRSNMLDDTRSDTSDDTRHTAPLSAPLTARRRRRLRLR